MARVPCSYTVTREGGFFHVVNRVNGSPRYFLFRNLQAGRKYYRGRLLYRGVEEGREGQVSIPEAVIEEQKQCVFTRPGLYLKRRRFCTDGLVLGTAEQVMPFVKILKAAGTYPRRCPPVEL